MHGGAWTWQDENDGEWSKYAATDWSLEDDA